MEGRKAEVVYLRSYICNIAGFDKENLACATCTFILFTEKSISKERER